MVSYYPLSENTRKRLRSNLKFFAGITTFLGLWAYFVWWLTNGNAIILAIFYSFGAIIFLVAAFGAFKAFSDLSYGKLHVASGKVEKYTDFRKTLNKDQSKMTKSDNRKRYSVYFEVGGISFRVIKGNDVRIPEEGESCEIHYTPKMKYIEKLTIH